jgi:hypothetical protein
MRFRQDENEEWRLKKAEVHAALGDALTVREEFDEARTELTNAYTIQVLLALASLH